MKSLFCLIALFVSLISLSSCNGSNEDLKSKLLPKISEAYKDGKWEQVIQLTDSLRNKGISYTDYIGDKGFDVAYCEALIATGQADKAVAEIKRHISAVNPQDYYAYHTLGVAYSELKDTVSAIDSYHNSVRINPGYARPYIHLAHLYEKKDVEKCMNNYSAAIQLFGNHEMYDEVLRFGFESWEVDSTNTIILKYMGDACFAKEDLQNAKALYGRVMADAGEKGSAVPQVLFESDYQLALINYFEGNYQDAYTLLEIIYANEKGFPKSSNSVLFGAYILGAAATQQMGEDVVSSKLMELANEIDSSAAKEHYDYFISLHKK